jgi:hypothetical protein
VTPLPSAKIPTVLFPAAAPADVAEDADAADATALLEYVYLSRVEMVEKLLLIPSAKIPTVLLPVAEPAYEPTDAEPPHATEQFE